MPGRYSSEEMEWERPNLGQKPEEPLSTYCAFLHQTAAASLQCASSSDSIGFVQTAMTVEDSVILQLAMVHDETWSDEIEPMTSRRNLCHIQSTCRSFNDFSSQLGYICLSWCQEIEIYAMKVKTLINFFDCHFFWKIHHLIPGPFIIYLLYILYIFIIYICSILSLYHGFFWWNPSKMVGRTVKFTSLCMEAMSIDCCYWC